MRQTHTSASGGAQSRTQRLIANTAFYPSIVFEKAKYKIRFSTHARPHSCILLFALLFALPSWAKESLTDDRIIGVWQPARTSFGKDPENYCLVKIDRRYISSREYPNKKEIKFTYEIIAQDEYAIVVKLGGKKEVKDSCNRLTSDAYLRFDEAWHFQCLSEQRYQQKHGVLKACPQMILSGDGFGLTGYRTKEEAIETSDTPTFWSQFFPFGPK